ncbi:MAG: alanyl-tRNA editing protein [Candidatus Poseidoniaceae archaeon]
MNTTKLYLDNIEAAYNTKFAAKVISIDGNKIGLDRTLFYPIGGGQNWDTGRIITSNEELQVSEVRGRNLVEHHVNTDHNLTVGDEIIGEIDWDRRYSHMRMHTAQHLMSGLAYELFDGTRTVGNQINVSHSRIDFNPISFDESMMKELSDSANQYIRESTKVYESIMTREEINSIMPEDRTNMDLLPKSVKDLRVITIGNEFDLCPCAGTHVANLSEIGDITIVSKKSKGKGTQRIKYELNNNYKVKKPNLQII